MTQKLIISAVDLPPILPPIRPPLFAEPGEPDTLCRHCGQPEPVNEAGYCDACWPRVQRVDRMVVDIFVR